MVEQTANNTAASPEVGTEAETEQDVPAAAKRTRTYSEVEFPYIDLEQALLLAQAMHKHAGGECRDKELAAWLNQSPDGGTYKARRTAARMFGLVDIQAGTLTLTQLGRDALDDVKGRVARAEAFLNPELYRVLYDAFGGHVLPPPPAIERRIEQAGVSPKQKVRARQAFQKSAIFAGYVDQATGRFVKPGNAGMRPQDENRNRAQDDAQKGGDDGTGGGDGLNLDPLLIELLRKIPKKEEGWAAAKRVRWFRTFAMNVSQIYDADEEPVELKIEAVRDES